MKTIGIDIGTTTICGVLIEAETGELLEAKTLPNSTQLESAHEWEKIQNPKEIVRLCQTLAESFRVAGESVISIGVTGQMHGILYLDKCGNPVTPLYTWQDARGNQPYRKQKTYSSFLTEATGYPLAVGYGMVTHFYNMENGLIPKDAAVFCTIADYAAMKLGGESTPILHPSMAASIGGYRPEQGCFDLQALGKAGIGQEYLPEVSKKEKEVMYKNARIPVAMALGDNQASFLGSVGAESSLLVNVGTGSQISVLCNEIIEGVKGEFRPYVDGYYLCVGSSLCGGYAYTLLGNFFREAAVMLGGTSQEDIYLRMNEAAAKVYHNVEKITANTQFNGTRDNPDTAGGFGHIRAENFHPAHFVLGTLQGICDELHNFYRQMPEDIVKEKIISASGNGIRLNPVLQKIFRDTFGMCTKIPAYSEEASYGSALFSLYALGFYKNLQELQKKIRYQAQ